MTAANSTAPLLRVEDLQVCFDTLEGEARAVRGASFTLEKGEALGIVGESGSGKSVTAFSIMRLIKKPGRIVGGKILLEGRDILKMPLGEAREIRGRRISMIFQEPMTSLNPLFTIGDQVMEMYSRRLKLGRAESRRRALEMLEKVRIPSPARRALEHPHQFSGGMRQRVMIAMALACDPEILIADEPTTALDVTIQAQVIDLILELKEQFGASIMMITHDLGVIAETVSRVVVMYAGQVVEAVEVLALFEDPLHPYTRALLKSIPQMDVGPLEARSRLTEIPGLPPGPFDLPPGCPFGPRCPEVRDICRREPPELIRLPDGREVRCHNYRA